MATASYILMLLSGAVAVAAWAVGSFAFRRALVELHGAAGGSDVLLAVAWPFVTDRIRDRGAASATTVNHALVALIAAVTIGCTATALYTNFSFQSR